MQGQRLVNFSYSISLMGFFFLNSDIVPPVDNLQILNLTLTRRLSASHESWQPSKDYSEVVLTSVDICEILTDFQTSASVH